jgi:hypothetical protein
MVPLLPTIPGGHESPDDHVLEAQMLSDVQRTFDRADALFARSSLMLISGILVAFVGVVVFAFLTSGNYIETRTDLPVFVGGSSGSSIKEYRGYLWQSAEISILRSIAGNFRYAIIFIFLESIAWFLLKQYRALIEDYKAFYRIYLRRQNYLSSYLILRGRNFADAAEILVSASMLQEDLSGRLPKGEELESRLQLEFAERSPFSSAANFIERMANVAQSAWGGKSEKKKGEGPNEGDDAKNKSE